MPIKRALKLAKQREVKPAPKPVVAGVVAERIVGAFCPVCGKTIIDRAVKVGYVSLGKTPYFESISWDPNKPFGITFEPGALQNWEHIDPADAPELFEALKQRFLEALREWEAKGWLTREELV